MKNKFLLIMFAGMLCMSIYSCGSDDNISSSNTDKSGSANGHEFVDLGLPSGTLWATCNIGASKPEEKGLYFAWGETKGYNTEKTISWSDYKWCKGSDITMTKYCTNKGYGAVDNKTELEQADDAAYVNWGSSWRMPTITQFQELINSSYTNTSWTTKNGVYGRLITSKTNGNSIFLPTGYDDEGNVIASGKVGSYGAYWSRSLYSKAPNGAYGLEFDSENINCSFFGRLSDQSIRPVLNQNN